MFLKVRWETWSYTEEAPQKDANFEQVIQTEEEIHPYQSSSFGRIEKFRTAES